MSDLEVLVSHRDRVVVRVRDTFVKLDHRPGRPGPEVAALAAAPVPTPAVLWHHDGALALARVPGAPLDDASPSAAWAAAGATARRIHDAPPPAGAEIVFGGDAALGWIEDDRVFLDERELIEPDLFDAHLAIARRHLGGRDVPPVFLHGDYQPVHVFVDGEEVVGVIDWADACLGDPMFDLAVLTGTHQHRLDDVLRGYGDRDADPDAIRGWWSLRRLGELRWMVEHGYPIDDRLRALRDTL